MNVASFPLLICAVTGNFMPTAFGQTAPQCGWAQDLQPRQDVQGHESVAAFTGFSQKEEVEMLLKEVERGCAFSKNAAKPWAEDCWLNTSSVGVAAVGQRLLAAVVPRECNFKPTALPVRRFLAEEPGAHSDTGPSWTLLLHLSHGATCFDSGCRTHAPGDAVFWRNSGMGPVHATRLPESGGGKLLLNLGVFGEDGCRGLKLAAAGGSATHQTSLWDRGCAAVSKVNIYSEAQCQVGADAQGTTYAGTHSTDTVPKGCNCYSATYNGVSGNPCWLNIHATGFTGDAATIANKESLSYGRYSCMVQPAETTTTVASTAAPTVQPAAATTTPAMQASTAASRLASSLSAMFFASFTAWAVWP